MFLRNAGRDGPVGSARAEATADSEQTVTLVQQRGVGGVEQRGVAIAHSGWSGRLGDQRAGSRLGIVQSHALPEWFEVAVSVVLFDLALYGQHWGFHRVPWLWRLHLVHHVDLDLDATTGVRFHTVETLLSFAWKAVVIALLGAPALAVMIFEILLNATAIFNHSNVCLPVWFDGVLRLVLITPDMHRVHHYDREP